MDMRTETATLGGGCFWCLEAVFQELRGVIEVTSGYSGGGSPNPNYEQVCTGGTGHAEVVQIVYDPDVITYQDLLDVFFTIHDPTTLNRQGADVGTQYRSLILYHSPEQEQTARDTIQRLRQDKVWAEPIVTKVQPFVVFYAAEEYHRDYLRRNPDQGYCRAVVAPKVAKFRKQHLARLKDSA